MMPFPMLRLTRVAISLVTLAVASACVPARGIASASGNVPVSRSDAINSDASSRNDSPCVSCDAIPLPTEITRAVQSRIATLMTRGGDCGRLGTVLESSFRSGRIRMRPYMWRVGTHLASGEAKPNGDMVLAREIDSLNVGVRTVDDVLFTMEHEAAHIAFDLASGNETSEEKANQTVHSCQQASAPAAGSSTPIVPSQAAGLTVVGPDGQSRAVTAADLAKLSRHDTTVSAHDVKGRYSGAALIVPGEKKPARWVRQVVRISLGRAP